MKNKTLIIVLGILALAVTYYLVSPLFIVKEANESLPRIDYVMNSPGGMMIDPAEQLFSGDFVASAHDVSGRVAVHENNGQNILRFEEFYTINGPSLYIYLATDTSAEDYIDLGKIKATKGSVNYEIPAGVDIEKYDTVLVWCKPFGVLFSYAELKKIIINNKN